MYNYNLNFMLHIYLNISLLFFLFMVQNIEYFYEKSWYVQADYVCFIKV